MTCHFCGLEIDPSELHQHHITPKSQGGFATAPTHPTCHTNHHSTNGHFRYWGSIGGQISALDRHWAFYLKNVKDDPIHEINRQFYKAHYEKKGGEK